MIYLEVEDSKDGLVMCQKIVEIFFHDYSSQIIVESFNGIVNLTQKIDSMLNRTTENDQIIIVLDYISENKLVFSNLKSAREYLRHVKGRQIYWIDTRSFELEMLAIKGIELFGNYDVYLKYFFELRELFCDNGRRTEILTDVTKENALYDEMYDKVRAERLRTRKFTRLEKTEIEDTITIESISKTILKRMFLNKEEIRPVRSCWINDCCYKYLKMSNEERIKLCKYEMIDKCSILQKQSECDMYKLRALINETSYRRIIAKISEILDIQVNVDKELSILDLCPVQVIISNYINKVVNKK